MLEMDDQYYAVELGRGARGFGFSIRGGREFSSMPLFVLRIAIDGPAAADGRLRVGKNFLKLDYILRWGWGKSKLIIFGKNQDFNISNKDKN